MSSGLNKVMIIGNLGKDPEIRYMPNGNACATVSIATSDNWVDKVSGEKQERTEWHRVIFFNRIAEIVGEYLRKGSKIYVEGSLRTRKWQNKNGADKYTTEIVASDLKMLSPRKENSLPQNYDYDPTLAAIANQNNINNTNNHQNFDDDVPF